MVIKTLGNLRQLLSDWFILEQIKTICFELEIEYDELGGENLPKSGKIRELIRTVHANKQLPKLIEAVERRLRHEQYKQKIDWPRTREQMARLQASVLDDSDFIRLSPPFQAPADIPNYLETSIFVEAARFLHKEHHQAAILGIHGYAGVGKSALAIHLAHQFREEFEDGVLWIDLKSRSLDSNLVSMAMAYEQGEQINQAADLSSKAQFIRQLLANRRVLTVIDQADSGDYQVLKWLLPNGRRNIVIVTTRNLTQLERLDAANLALPPFTVEQTFDYLELFLRPERVAQEGEAIAKLHSLIGGTPQVLAIAAGQLQASPALKIADYSSLLSNERTRLENLGFGGDERLDIAASIELSYITLPSERFQRTFATLGVFEAFTFDSWAVSAVAKLNNVQAQLVLGQLAKRSLISHIAQDQYEINPLLKAYAVSKLEDPERYYGRAANYFAEKAAQSQLQKSFSSLNKDWENVTGLMQWAYARERWETLIKGVLGLTQFSLGVMGFMDLRGYWSEARELLALALEGAQAQEDATAELRIRLNLAGFAHKQNDHEAMIAQLEEAGRLFTEIPAAEVLLYRFQYYDLMSKSLLQVDRSKASEPLLEGIRTLAKVEMGDADYQRGYLYSELSGTLGRSGRFEQAQKAAQESLKLLPSWSTTAKLVSLINLGIIFMATGRLLKSREFLDKAVRVAEEIGDTNRLASAWVNLGTNSKQLGRLNAANEYYANALSIYQRLGNIHYQLGTQMNMGQVNFMLGDNEEAKNLYRQAITLAGEHGVKDIEALLYSNLVDFLLAEGKVSEAAEIAKKGWDLCQTLGFEHLRPTIMRNQLQVLQAQGKHNHVVQAIEQVLQGAEKTNDRLEQGIACRVSGVSLSAVGQTVDARAALEKSAEILTEQEPFEQGRTLLALADLYTQQGNINKARAQLEKAQAIFEPMSARRELNKVHSLLLSIDTDSP